MTEYNSYDPLVGDFVFEDLDLDGIQDSNEPGIANVEVKLLDGYDHSVLETTFTDGNGKYSFQVNPHNSGGYKIMFNNPDESVYMFSPRQVGDNPEIDSDGPMSDVFHLDPFSPNTTIDAGLTRKTSQPQAGIDIEKATNGEDADSPTGPKIPVGDTATFTYVVTNTGNLALSGVEVIDDAGTPSHTGDDFNPHFSGGDSNNNDRLDPNETWTYEASRTVTEGQYTNKGKVTAHDPDGETVMDMDPSNHFGEPPATAGLGDFVFEDVDEDGIQDNNEPGISGATVKLQSPNGQTLDTTTTDGSGFYEFSGLTPGDYKIMFTQPSGFDSVSPFQAGGNRAIDSDANPNNGLMSNVVNLSPGEFDSSIDAGFFNAPPETAGLGDFVFEDRDADGIQDGNEPGIAGATVKLQSPNGATLDTTTTNSSGFYEFTGLTPGDYKIMFTQPSGFDAASPFQAGGNRAIDSDANPNNGLMSNVVNLSPGEFEGTIDAGFYKFAALGDKVFNDLDRDGIQDAGEPGISGATVKLQNPNGQTLDTTTTNSNGIYEFSDLTPGDYKVMFNQPNGFVPSPFEVGNNSAIDSDANPNNGLMSDVVTLTSGETDNTLDGGFFKDVNADIDIEKFVKVNSGVVGGGGDDDDDDNSGYYSGGSGGDDDDDDGSSGDPNKGFLDADHAPGPDALVGSHVEFKYIVTNPGETALDHIKVTDNKLYPDPLLKRGLNVGDQNRDGLLNPGEKWIFTASETAKKGLQTNIGTAMGKPVDRKGNPLGLPNVTDSDPANYTGIKKGKGGGGDDDDDDNGFSHFIIGDDDDDGNFFKHLAGDDDGGSFSTFHDISFGGDQSFSYLVFAED